MDRAPLPPHERPWRHPSELGPPAHEPTSTSGRVLIATTATLSLLLIGLMVVTMTPERSQSPQTASSALSAARTPTAALQQPELPVVTPIGDDGLAVTTLGAIAGLTGTMQARLPDGTIYDVELVATDRAAGLAVVALPEAARADGYELASSPPSPSDTVLVSAQPPVVVAMMELAGLDVQEGTPVLDDHGDLLGLCTDDGGEVSLMTVATMPDPATTAPSTTTGPTTTARPTTTAPATTAPPATTVPTTVATTAPATTVPNASGPPTSGPGTSVSGASATTAPG